MDGSPALSQRVGQERSRGPSNGAPAHEALGSDHPCGTHRGCRLPDPLRLDPGALRRVLALAEDVAQYIDDHLDEVAFQTAEELARRANTSSSTVVRFSQALGFEGFPELQTSAREEFRRRVAA